MYRLGLMLIFCLYGCSTDKEVENNTLRSYIGTREIVADNVISCAASNLDDQLISVFLYPREGVSNIQYFEGEGSDSDKNDFSKYSQLNAPMLPVFNGYLLKFEVAVAEDKWVIVSFEEDDKIHLSNPIRLKQFSKPTEYLPENISLNKTELGMPLFSWLDGAYDDTKIYFQVVSDAQGELLSGTYTFEQKFQYYQLENVVLNITSIAPPVLMNDANYRFTLLAVSEDNWVNQFSEINFDIHPE